MEDFGDFLEEFFEFELFVKKREMLSYVMLNEKSWEVVRWDLEEFFLWIFIVVVVRRIWIVIVFIRFLLGYDYFRSVF